jgi:anti-sigma regulatory factor (Ser/Thr protein kinase)
LVYRLNYVCAPVFCKDRRLCNKKFIAALFSEQLKWKNTFGNGDSFNWSDCMISKKSIFILLDKKGLACLRKEVSSFLNDIDVDRTVIEDVVLVINEAATNVIKHKNSNEIFVNLQVTTQKIKVNIKSFGERASNIEMSDIENNLILDDINNDVMQENGRGILIMSKLTDLISMTKDFDIRFEKRLIKPKDECFISQVN